MSCHSVPIDELRDGQESVIDRFVGRWWVVHARPRTEKKVAARCEQMGIQCFLPLARVRRRYASRTKDVRLPLFPGYLFLCGGQDDRYRTLTTNRVVSVLEVRDQERIRSDLRQIYRAVTGNVAVDLYPGIRRGRRCRVRSGCLQGLEGVVLRRHGLCRVSVGVEILGQSAEVELDPSVLDPID